MNDKEKQIEELASLMADCNTTCDECFEKYESVMTMKIKEREKYCQVYAYAQRAVEQGYRNTFTSDLASDTQKAFKDGYSKGVDYGIEFGKVLLYKTRKETAKEIFGDLWNNFVEYTSYAMDSTQHLGEYDHNIKISVSDVICDIICIAKKYGVDLEVEE